MDKIEFQEADLVAKYQDKQDAVVDEDGDGDEDGGEDAVLANGFKLQSRDKEEEQGVVNHYLILFWFVIIFMMIPLIGNIFQLHFEIMKWNKDPVLTNTNVPTTTITTTIIIIKVEILVQDVVQQQLLQMVAMMEW